MFNYTYPSIAKFAEFVQLKDYRPPTKKEYVRYVLRFADHFQRDPAAASQDDLRRYYLFLRHPGPSTALRPPNHDAKPFNVQRARRAKSRARQRTGVVASGKDSPPAG